MRLTQLFVICSACSVVVACVDEPVDDVADTQAPGATTQPLNSDCPTFTLGDGATCQEVVGLRAAAAETCNASSLELALVAADEAACEAGLAASLVVRCCPFEPRANCWSYLVGDGSSCVTDTTRWTEALAECTAAELVLGDFDVNRGDCDEDASIQASFFCCEAQR